MIVSNIIKEERTANCSSKNFYVTLRSDQFKLFKQKFKLFSNKEPDSADLIVYYLLPDEPKCAEEHPFWASIYQTVVTILAKFYRNI